MKIIIKKHIIFILTWSITPLLFTLIISKEILGFVLDKIEYYGTKFEEWIMK